MERECGWEHGQESHLADCVGQVQEIQGINILNLTILIGLSMPYICKHSSNGT